MSKVQVSRGADFVVTYLDRSFRGPESEVLKVSGEDGSVTMGGLSVDASGNLSLGLPVYSDSDRPDASLFAVGVAVWNSSDNAPNWSDGTNWRDANGTLT